MSAETTKLLARAGRGDQDAAARLMPLVYDRLHELAGRYLGRGSGSVTLQPTVVVHEAYLRLVDRDTTDFKGQTHFFAVAAVAMRHVLIDHARGRGRAKRGGDWKRVSLTDAAAVSNTGVIDLLALEDALVKLAKLDARGARVVEFRFFGGLTHRQVAEVLGVSEPTVQNDWRVARAWLRRELSGEDTEETS